MSVTGSSQTVSTTTSVTQTGALTIEFTLTKSGAPKLTDGSGKTYIYDSSVTNENVGSATPIEVEANLSDLFGTMTVAISKIYLTTDTDKNDIKGIANTMKSYAGTYNFKVVSDNSASVMSGTKPTTKEAVGLMSNTAIEFTVTVAANGNVTFSLPDLDGEALGTDQGFWYAVRGAASLQADVQATYTIQDNNG